MVLLAAPGTVVWRVPTIARMDRLARLCLAWAAGVIIAALILYVTALVGIRWTRTLVAIPLIVLTVAGLKLSASNPRSVAPGLRGAPLAVLAVFTAVSLYAIVDARVTCGDLIYIWGPKAIAFLTARTIDMEFLAYPHYIFMHPDYPPLVPLAYTWGSLIAQRFSWWGSLLLTPLIIVTLTATLHAFGAAPRRVALFAAIVTYAFSVSYVNGAGDPFLQMYEAIAVIALTFAPESREARAIAAVSLAAAAFTKVEGATFVVIVVIAFALAQRKPRNAVLLALPAIALLGTWLLVCAKFHLWDQYSRAKTTMYWEVLPVVLRDVTRFISYKVGWLPWIAAAAPLAIRWEWRRAAFPLLVAAGTYTAAHYFYLHDPAPAFWIASSAERVFLTPLLALAVAGATQTASIATSVESETAVAT